MLLQVYALYPGDLKRMMWISIVSMIGDYRMWKSMGMKIIDKGVYQKWIKKSEAEIELEKDNYDL